MRCEEIVLAQRSLNLKYTETLDAGQNFQYIFYSGTHSLILVSRWGFIDAIGLD